MTTKIENLKDLLVEEGRDLFNATEQELNELPVLEKNASSVHLKKILQKQIQTVKEQKKQILEAFSKLNSSCQNGKCAATQAILRRTNERIRQSADPEVRDAGIISSLQYLNHRKIAGLGSSVAYANQIGQKDAARILHRALEEEKKMDEELSRLAGKEINPKAATVFG